MGRPLAVRDLGRTAYLDALSLQRDLQLARVAGELPDTLLLTEHEPVFTLGRGHPEPDLRVPPSVVEAAGIAIVPTERGGDITYHGPGQLVAYGIVDLRAWGLGVVDYVAGLEEAAIRLFAEYSVAAGRIAGARGAWAGPRKIASVGVHVRRHVTMHGIAINLSPNLNHFALINPCGLPDVEATSVFVETGRAVSVSEAGEAFARHFAAVFGCEVGTPGRV